MVKFRVVIAVLVLLLTTCTSAPPGISVDPMVQDLGQVRQERLEATYTVRNQGGTPLQIDKVTTSCECTNAKMDQDIIPPGSSALLRVTMDPVADDFYGNLTRLIYIRSNDPTAPEIQVELRVSIVKANVTATPPPPSAALAQATRSPTASGSPPVAGKPTPSSPPVLASGAKLDSAAYFLPKPVGALQNRVPPPDVPACQGAKSLEQPIDFSWEQRDPSDWREVHIRISDEHWTYYRCGQPMADAVAFYRQWMVAPLYDWSEDHVEDYPEGALLVFNKRWECSSVGHRWVYLWLFPAKSDSQLTDLVAVWYDYDPY